MTDAEKAEFAAWKALTADEKFEAGLQDVDAAVDKMIRDFRVLDLDRMSTLLLAGVIVLRELAADSGLRSVE